MEKIEMLRSNLHNAIRKGDKLETLKISRKLDKLIVDFMKRRVSEV